MAEILKLAREVEIPIDALMQPIALMGNRGSGKTYGASKLFELAYGLGVQCIAIDPIGRWWGLRLGADGKSKGLDKVYIFGGKRGDYPLKPDQGRFIARLLVERRIHALLDVSLMSKSARRQFVADFAEEFYLLKKTEEDESATCVVFIEEAHAFAPQKPMKGDERMLGAIADVATEGRNCGLGLVLCDQRAARVNKDVLAMMEILIALKTHYELDRDALNGWVVQKAAEKVNLLKELPFLKTGEGFFYAPIYELFERIQILTKKTYDSSKTRKIGVKSAPIGKLTPVDAEKLRTVMAETVKAAEANDPRKLQARVAELERELERARKTAPLAAEALAKVARESTPAKFPKADLKMLGKYADKIAASAKDFEELLKRFDDQRDRLAQAQQVVTSGLGNFRHVIDRAQGRADTSFESLPSHIQKRVRAYDTHPRPRPIAPKRVVMPIPMGDAGTRYPLASDKLPIGEHAVLRAAAQFEDGAARDEITVLTGYKMSTRNAYIARLGKKRLVEETDRTHVLASKMLF